MSSCFSNQPTSFLRAAFETGDPSLAFTTDGPFLVAWSPPSDKGKPDVLVLFKDLSDVTTYPEAEDEFERWERQIEQRPWAPTGSSIASASGPGNGSTWSALRS